MRETLESSGTITEHGYASDKPFRCKMDPMENGVLSDPVHKVVYILPVLKR